MLIQLTKTHHEEPKTVFDKSNDFIFPTEFAVTKIKSLKLELQSIIISLLYNDNILLEIVGTHFWCKALSFWQFFTRCWWPIAFMYTALYTNHTLLGSKGTTTSNVFCRPHTPFLSHLPYSGILKATHKGWCCGFVFNPPQFIWTWNWTHTRQLLHWAELTQTTLFLLTKS